MQKALKKYLKQQKRITSQIRQLILLIREHKNPLKILQKISHKTTKPLQVFKLLILLHACCIQDLIKQWRIIQVLAEIEGRCGFGCKWLDDHMCQQIIPPYKLYIQKCYEHKLSLEPPSPNPCPSPQPSHRLPIPQAPTLPQLLLYQLLNLLKLGASLIQPMMRVIRYYRQSHEYIIDFNAILGQDLARVYNQLSRILGDHFGLFEQPVVEELYSIHENLFLVFYNSYTHMHVRQYQPQFMNIQHIQQLHKHQKRQLREQQEIQLKSSPSQNRKTPDRKQSQMSTNPGSNFYSKISFSKEQSNTLTHKDEENDLESYVKVLDSYMNQGRQRGRDRLEKVQVSQFNQQEEGTMDNLMAKQRQQISYQDYDCDEVLGSDGSNGQQLDFHIYSNMKTSSSKNNGMCQLLPLQSAKKQNKNPNQNTKINRRLYEYIGLYGSTKILV